MTKLLNLGEKVLSTLWLHGHVLLPGDGAAIWLKAVQRPQVWLWGGDGVKPPVLGSFSLALVMERNAGNKKNPDAIQTGAKWRSRDQNPHSGQAKGSGGSRNVVFTCTSPWDGVGDGASGQAAVPLPSPSIHTGVMHARNTQCWESLVTG